MSATIDTSDGAVFAALRAWMLTILPTGAEVIMTQDNRVPMPARGTTFVTMNNVGKTRLSTNSRSYASSTQVASDVMATEYQIQIDIYGPAAGEWAQIIQTLARAVDTNDALPAGIQILYADDPVQLPMIAGEHQFEARWKLQAHIQYNPTISQPYQSATALGVGLAEIDKRFHP